MGCNRGRASPSSITIKRLFAASAGFCQNPNCTNNLFIDAGSKVIHVAEMAHIIAAEDNGPRADQGLAVRDRGAYDNLILLCPRCHTIIDKAPEDFPSGLILSWKREHEYKLTKIFGAIEYSSRAEVRKAIEPLMIQNRAIHRNYNPELDYRFNPESEMADVWKHKMVEQIIPNSRRIMATLEMNRHFMSLDEIETLELFRQHVYDLELRHLTGIVLGGQSRFPQGMENIMEMRHGSDT